MMYSLDTVALTKRTGSRAGSGLNKNAKIFDKDCVKALEKNTDLQDERGSLKTELAINKMRLGSSKRQND